LRAQKLMISRRLRLIPEEAQHRHTRLLNIPTLFRDINQREDRSALMRKTNASASVFIPAGDANPTCQCPLACLLYTQRLLASQLNSDVHI